MSKYDLLEAYLAGKADPELQLSFMQIGQILGQALPNCASRPQWWDTEVSSQGRHAQSCAWRNAGYDAFLIEGARRVRFVRRYVRVQAGDRHTFYVAPERLTDEEIATAKSAMENLVRHLARVAAKTCHELGIEFDMDDPEVARDVMKATFEGLFLAPRAPKSHRKSPLQR